MAVEHELENIIMNAGFVQEKTLTAVSSPFYEGAVDMTNIMVESIAPDYDWQKNVFFNETLKRIEPIVDYLTKPRSIDDFRKMQEEVIRFLWLSNKNNLENVKLKEYERNIFSEKNGESAMWIDWPLRGLISKYSILSATAVYESLYSLYYKSPEKAIKSLLDDIGFSSRKRQNKLVDLNKATRITNKLRSIDQTFPGRSGYIVGKFRNGVHDEHVQLIERAKRALGHKGVLFLGLESKESIHNRRGQDHFTLPDHVRIAQITELRSVDYVILHNPNKDDLMDIRSFYTGEQEKLKPNFWFIGTEDYHWRPLFEKIAQSIGAILLWDRSTIGTTTSELIENKN